MLLVLAVIITMFLASKPVIALAQPLIELRWSKLNRMLKKRENHKKPSSVILLDGFLLLYQGRFRRN